MPLLSAPVGRFTRYPGVVGVGIGENYVEPIRTTAPTRPSFRRAPAVGLLSLGRRAHVREYESYVSRAKWVVVAVDSVHPAWLPPRRDSAYLADASRPGLCSDVDMRAWLALATRLRSESRCRPAPRGRTEYGH